MRSRLLAALISGILLTGAISAQAEPSDADCSSGHDTPPAIHLGGSGVCSGSFGDGLYGSDRWDIYTFDATKDDFVALGYTDSCSLMASGSPGWKHTYDDGIVLLEDKEPYSFEVNYEPVGWDGGSYCSNTMYSMSVAVYANDRPDVVDPVDVPITALPATPTNFRVRGADPDNNLAEVGLVHADHPDLYGNGTEYIFNETFFWDGDSPWHFAPVDAGGEGTITTSFYKDSVVRILARDTYGAIGWGSAEQAVTLVQDDCSTGGDITSYTLSLGATCRAHIAGFMGDGTDGFTVEVPAGGNRIWIDLTPVYGVSSLPIKSTSPSGVVTATYNGLVLAAEEGTWTFEIGREDYVYSEIAAAYDLTIRSIGPATAPALTSSASTQTPHVWENVDLTYSAPHPDLPVSYLIDWGDGSPEERMPPLEDGKPVGFIDSSVARTSTHQFQSTPKTPAITVTATALDGISGAATIPISVRASTDGCETGSGEPLDAPASASDFSSGSSFDAAFHVEAPDTCSGEIGYFIGSTQPEPKDDSDVYNFRVCPGGCDSSFLNSTRGEFLFRVTVAAGPTTGLRATVRSLIGGSTTTVPPGETRTLVVVAAWAPGLDFSHFVTIDQPTGKGTYSLTAQLQRVIG